MPLDDFSCHPFPNYTFTLVKTEAFQPSEIFHDLSYFSGMLWWMCINI